MHVAVFIAALIVLVVALAWAHLRYWSTALALPLPYASTEELATADGSTIVLRRVSVPTSTDGGPPVLLVHGLGANHRNNDLHPERSLARHLQNAGRDVWLLTLRSGLPTRGAARRRVRFEAMAFHDVPLAIEAVRSRTGAASIDYVGFSMGGMLLYAAIGRSVPEAWLRRVVICGSPGRIRIWRSLGGLVRRVPGALVPGVPLRLVSRLFAFASEWFVTPFHGITVNPRNVPPGLTRVALVNLVEDIPASLNADFASFSQMRELRVRSEPVLAGLATVSVPALFIAGAADRLAPAASVRRAFEAWGAERSDMNKRFVIFGREHGHAEDYGHGDLAFGTHVSREIFPTIQAFLADT